MVRTISTFSIGPQSESAASLHVLCSIWTGLCIVAERMIPLGRRISMRASNVSLPAPAA